MKGTKRAFAYTLLLLLICIFCFVGCDEGGDPSTCEHAYSEWVQTGEVSCTAPVQQNRVCTLCGLVETKGGPRSATKRANGRSSILPLVPKRGSKPLPASGAVSRWKS